MRNLLFALVPFFLFSCSDPCKTSDCQNGAPCVDGTCICPDQYTGPNCANLWRESVIGTYIGSGQCNGTQQPTETMSITPGSTDNPARINFNPGFFALMNGPQTFTIPQQLYFDAQAGQTITINTGGGSIQGQNLSLELNVTTPNGSGICLYTLNRTQ